MKSFCAIIKELKDNPDKYEAYDAPNGWGDHEGILKILEELMFYMASDSNAVIEIDR